jgi:excisionase family DNA binding protein
MAVKTPQARFREMDPLIRPNLASAHEVYSLAQLSKLLEAHDRYQVSLDFNGTRIELPDPVYRVLRLAVTHLAVGHALSVVSHAKELTTTQAARLLNVSRPYFTSLLKRKLIDFVPVGSHRRVKLDDLLRYRDQGAEAFEARREKSMAESRAIGDYDKQYDELGG